MKRTMGIRKVMVANEDAYRCAFGSLLCAALALVIAPVVFGLLGFVAGAVAFWMGGRWWGTAGVTASVGAVIINVYLASGLIA